MQSSIQTQKNITKTIGRHTVALLNEPIRPFLTLASAVGEKVSPPDVLVEEPSFCLVVKDSHKGVCGTIGYYSAIDEDAENPFVNIPQLKLFATGISHQREVFALLCGSACLMNSCGATHVATIFNDRIIDVYRHSGVSIPSIDATVLAQGTAGFGSWEYTNREYRHLLALAQLCEIEVALYFANVTTSEDDWVIG